jgi:hypothetical protein
LMILSVMPARSGARRDCLLPHSIGGERLLAEQLHRGKYKGIVR